MCRLPTQPALPALCRSELLSYVPREPKAYESISTAGWCQFFQCALHLEVRRVREAGRQAGEAGQAGRRGEAGA